MTFFTKDMLEMAVLQYKGYKPSSISVNKEDQVIFTYDDPKVSKYISDWQFKETMGSEKLMVEPRKFMNAISQIKASIAQAKREYLTSQGIDLSVAKVPREKNKLPLAEIKKILYSQDLAEILIQKFGAVFQYDIDIPRMYDWIEQHYNDRTAPSGTKNPKAFATNWLHRKVQSMQERGLPVETVLKEKPKSAVDLIKEFHGL